MLPAGRKAACRAHRARSIRCRAAVALDFDTTAFQKDLVEFAGTSEYIVKGGRDKFENLPRAFKDIKEVHDRLSTCTCIFPALYAL